MYLDVKHMKYIEAIGRLQSVTKAAKELHMAQPPLSQQIKKIEKDVNIQIFDRSKKKMFLTREGELLVERIRPLLAQIDELSNYISDINNSKTGDVRIATLPSIVPLLSKIINNIWEQNPGVHITLLEGLSDEVINLVNTRQAQIGITRLPIINNNLDYSVIGNDVIRAFVTKEHSLALKKRILPQDLQNESLLVIKSFTAHNSFLQVYKALEESGSQPNIIGEMSSVSSILQIVSKGHSIGLAPKSGETLAPTDVISLPFNEPDILIPTAVVWLKNESNPLIIHIKNTLSRMKISSNN